MRDPLCNARRKGSWDMLPELITLLHHFTYLKNERIQTLLRFRVGAHHRRRGKLVSLSRRTVKREQQQDHFPLWDLWIPQGKSCVKALSELRIILEAKRQKLLG